MILRLHADCFICALGAWQDSVTIGFDGQDKEGIFEEVQARLQRMAGMDSAQPCLHPPQGNLHAQMCGEASLGGLWYT